MLVRFWKPSRMRQGVVGRSQGGSALGEGQGMKVVFRKGKAWGRGAGWTVVVRADGGSDSTLPAGSMELNLST